MTATTTNLGLPYPELSDAADISDAVQPLAEAIDGLLEPGDLKMTARATASTGWLLCDGASYLRATYPALFTALGGASSPFGLPDGTHFNVPDYKGRSPMGAGTGSGLSAKTRGTKLGVETPTMPSHDHGGGNHRHNISASNDLSGAFATPAYADGGFFNVTEYSGAIISAQSVGSGTDGNVHPVQVCNIVIKT